MASSDILNETLNAVTGIKLSQLEKQRHAYQSAKRSLLDSADDEMDSKKRVRLLADGAEKLPAMRPLADSPLVSLSNIRRFVEQAECDPSVSESLLTDYESSIRNELDVQSNKYDFATLYGQLVTDWTSSGGAEGADSDSDFDFVALGREEMYKQRATWEEYVLNAKQTDVCAIKAYLEQLFARNPSKDVVNAFETFTASLKRFQERWDTESKHFTEDTVAGSIKSILRSDVISDYKRTALNDFLGNEIVLREIADVLNMRMATRESFEWDGVAVIEQRRQLNGRYRFYPDEDLLQMIFLQYIGLRWATELRRLLRTFALDRGVLKSPARKLTNEAARRRRYFLGNALVNPGDSIESDMERHWKSDIFLDQLPDDMFETRGAYGDDKSESEPGDTRSSPLAVVQELVHRVQASIIMRKRMGENVTVIRSDFKWFGPSLPHSSIFAVLEYLGVQEDWLGFFKKVLESPISFKDEDTGAAPRIRKRGTPIGTPLAACLGEALLFCADFAVNQKADGARLYRLHDDLWLWGDVKTCTEGWNALTEFAGLMGLEFNEEKTGSCTILGDGSTESAKPHSRLPKGDVIWGFLRLDSGSGRFVINQAKVDAHIEELSIQLKACKSVFDFVQAWNLYGARFLRTNCGKVAGCFGREHVDSMLEAFKRIQARIFEASSGSVGQHLKQMIETRLGVTDIPDGFLYFPTSMGGLGLQNPFIDLCLLRDQCVQDPEELMDQFFRDEETDYRNGERLFAEMGPAPGNVRAAPGFPEPTSDWSDLRGEPFFDFKEFTQNREITSRTLGVVYRKLLASPADHTIELHGEAEMLAEHLRSRRGDREWSSYERWLLQLYAKEIASRFGSLDIVEEGLLPIGLMQMLRQSRFKWQN